MRPAFRKITQLVNQPLYMTRSMPSYSSIVDPRIHITKLFSPIMSRAAYFQKINISFAMRILLCKPLFRRDDD